jgi:AcrR family transcriptional regulator
VVADQVSGAPANTAKRSRANTLARLLDGAYEVFAERGFNGATVELVCEAGGFTRGAFYSNFASMEELFLALWDRQADRIVDSLAELVAELERQPGSGEAVTEVLATFHPYDRQWFLVNTEFLLHALRHPAVAEALAAHRRRLREEIAKVIDLIPDVEARRQPAGIDRDTHTRLVIAAFEGCQNQGFVEPAVAEAGVLQQSMLGLLLSGPIGGAER